MRVNQFVAQATGLSRRAVDRAIIDKRVKINEAFANIGQQVNESDVVSFDDNEVLIPSYVLLAINKPAGYICSRNGQGEKTVYDLLPENYRELKPIGRLDKESSGLLLFTNDGNLAHTLLHPKFEKIKVYLVRLDKPLSKQDQLKIESGKISLDGKPSKLSLYNPSPDNKAWQVTISEGRNRQIRRTFEKLGYKVTQLVRTQFGSYKLSDLGEKPYVEIYKQ